MRLGRVPFLPVSGDERRRFSKELPEASPLLAHLSVKMSGCVKAAVKAVPQPLPFTGWASKQIIILQFINRK